MPRYPQAILVSCEIPWDKQENLMEDLFRREVLQTLENGFNHLYVFGTAGEGYAVDTSRFRQIVQIFYEETRGDNVHPMVGGIGLSTANIVERVSRVSDFIALLVCIERHGADDIFSGCMRQLPRRTVSALQPAAYKANIAGP